ncbi:hypothetical protein HXV90_13100 [Lysinibacillus sp. JK80]|uniref:hypothetical protein n=1 Tax=Lysinibacillus sp. JK80 TaxID=2749809 RepID=UPI0022B9420E|nr:hypothetical protein [Lysinibacillus sp. JK80]WBF56751.1 hypothetical protein HXV90_13100 [Lysinibacillus sp. JK80]
MSSKEYKKGPGRPESYTDSELKELAVKIKYKFKGVKITPSLLDQETDIGRNTWSRRLKDFLQELNDPILRSIPLNGSDEIFLPNIEMIFEKHGDNKIGIIRELYSLEEMIDTLYSEVKLLRDENKKLSNYRIEAIKYKKQSTEQLQKAKYYEELYNKTVASSLYPHLYSKSPLLKEFNINNKLIDVKNNTDKHMMFKNIKLDVDVEETYEESLSLDEINKKEDVMTLLKDEFDL